MAIQKILVVDDSPTERYFLTDILIKNGFSVSTAENGEEALLKVKADKPQLILMDVVMPGQNGFQVTRAIARDPRNAGCARHHLHQQGPGNRPHLGLAARRARLHCQAGRSTGITGQNRGAWLSTEIDELTPL